LKNSGKNIKKHFLELNGLIYPIVEEPFLEKYSFGSEPLSYSPTCGEVIT